MISNKLKLLSIVAILMWSANALCQQAEVTKKLGDGSLIVEFQGQKYRAITDDQMKALDKVQLERDAYKKDVGDANAQIATLNHELETTKGKVATVEQQRDLAKNDLQDVRVFSAQQKQLLDQETQLRKDSQQFVPHSSGGLAGKFLDFFDRPAVQGLFKIGIPLLQTGRSFTTARCVP